MVALTVKQFVVGPVGTNCYFAINQATKEMFIVDPGAEAEKLIAQIDQLKVTPVAVLLTHGHFDHAGAAEEMAAHYQIPVYAGENEKGTLESTTKNLSGPMMGQPEVYHATDYLKDMEEQTIAGMKVRTLFTPGHTEGGVCYYLPNEMVVFSGDTLFCESVGRTDFPGGSMSAIVRSLREKLFLLPKETVVYPGHGDETSIGYEEKYNPYA